MNPPEIVTASSVLRKIVDKKESSGDAYLSGLVSQIIKAVEEDQSLQTELISHLESDVQFLFSVSRETIEEENLR